MEIKSITTAIREEKKYLTDINSGVIKPIRTPYNFINQCMLNGLHVGDILTIAGPSGSGKTSFLGELQEGICNLNDNIRILDFTFEYLARKKLSRMAAKKYGRTMKDIYKKGTDVPDYGVFANYPMHFVETPMTMDSIVTSIDKFCNKYPNDRTIVCLDHSLLVKNRKGDNERETLVLMCDTFNEIKKKYPIAIIMVSQLNDNIDETQRKVKLALQYPKKKDIFGGRASYHVSDFVMVLIHPTKLDLPTTAYGKYKLPLQWSGGMSFPKDLVYAHVIKARDGQSTITPLYDNLANYNLQEFDKAQIQKFYSTYFK